MSYIFTAEQIAHIKSMLKDEKVPDETRSNYADIYAYIRDELSSVTLLPGVNNSARWFTVATQANANTDSPFSTFIRSYTQRQGELRGVTITDELMQEASNQVAVNAIGDILASGVLPTIDQIAEHDAIAIGKVIFDSTIPNDSAGSKLNAGWSGAVGFSGLGTDQSWRLLGGDRLLNTVSDLKDILFAFDATMKAVDDVHNSYGDSGFEALEALLTLGINSVALLSDVVLAFFGGTVALPYAEMVFNLTLKNTSTSYAKSPIPASSKTPTQLISSREPTHCFMAQTAWTATCKFSSSTNSSLVI